MSLAAFATALLLLLLTPGPTNTLLAVAGASRGVRRSLPLMAAEIAGYFTTVLPLVIFAGPFIADAPLFATAVKLCSSAWVLSLAVRLWTNSPADREVCIRMQCVYWTTVTNPKALIIGLALIPAGTPQIAAYLAVLAATILVVAALWLSFGAAVIGAIHRRHPALIGRIAATCLLFFAAGLAGRAVGLV